MAEVGNCFGHDVKSLLGIDRHQHVTVAGLDLAKITFVNHGHSTSVRTGQLNNDMSIFLGEQMRVRQDQNC